MLRGLIKDAVAVAWDAARLQRYVREDSNAATSPLVVGYHQVVSEFRPDWRAGITPQQTSSAMFERHMDWIGRHYQFVSLDEIGEHFESRKPFTRPVAAITFDDGYRDVYLNAFPILKRKGIPAAMFVVTDIVGTRTPPLHDRLYAVLALALERWARPNRMLVERLGQLNVSPESVRRIRIPGHTVFSAMRAMTDVLTRPEIDALVSSLESDFSPLLSLEEMQPLTWEMVKQMSDAGITIGSHTKSHALLTAEDNDRVLEEVQGSKEALERQLGVTPRHFAYPDGRFNVKTAKAVASSYRFAYTICRHQLSAYPLVTIPRKMLWEKSCTDSAGRFSPAVMNCQVHGVFDWINGCSQMHGGVIQHRVKALLAPEGTARPSWHGGLDA
jgi:peptidoglycan/xylan/chitin deacetylase (PgdA/CDA1 family)